MVADDKDKPAFSYFLSLNLLETAGYRLGVLAGKVTWQLSVRLFLQF